MKKILLTIAIASSVFATDYTSMSAQDLANLRGTIPAEDRDAYKSAMQNQMQSLTPEERASLRGNSNSNYSSTYRTNNGTGNMYKGSKGGGR